MPQNNFWGCKLPDFHLLTGKTPFLRLLEKIQSPYTLLAAFPRTWYNREESHLGQLEFFSGCSFLIALNMILHLRIIAKKQGILNFSACRPPWITLHKAIFRFSSTKDIQYNFRSHTRCCLTVFVGFRRCMRCHNHSVT